MTAAVHIFAHSGVKQVPLVQSTRKTDDGSYFLSQPYLASEVLSADTGAAVSSSGSNAPAGTQALLVQVQDGKTIRYEINPGHRSTAASSSSPRLSGEAVFDFGVGYSISVIEEA